MRSEAAAATRATEGGVFRSGGRHALCPEQLGDELAENHRLAVGDEVDAAGPAALGSQHQPMDHVVDVGGGRAVAAAADPGEALLLDRRDEGRQDRRVARAPHEPGTDDDRLEAVGVGLANHLLGHRLRRGVERLRVGPQRRILVHVHERLARQQRRLRPDVHEPAHARCAGCLQRIARAAHVDALELLAVAPLAQVRGGVEDDIGARGAGAHRVAILEVAADRLGARARTPSPPHRPSGRARAPATRRATRRLISRPPMKPDPPVTNAVRPSSLTTVSPCRWRGARQ